MRKTVTNGLGLFAGLLFVLSVMASFQRAAPGVNLKDFDASHWISSLDAGKAFAAKQKKSIVLFFSDDKDEASDKLKASFVSSDDFVSELAKRHVLVNIDFAESRFAAAEDAETVLYDMGGASDAEKADAQKVVDALIADMNLARIYNVETTPAFYVLTKEGYVVERLSLGGDSSREDFEKALSGAEEKAAALEGELSAISSAKGLEKVGKIDALFESTPFDYRYLLSDLCQAVVDADPKNESGIVGKYVTVLANNRAVDFFFEQDYASGSAEFASAAENPILTAEEKQQMYYLAGYMLAQSGSMDYGTIKGHFQKAYDAYPEGEYAPKIREMVGLVEEREREFDEMLSQIQAENAEQPSTMPAQKPEGSR